MPTPPPFPTDLLRDRLELESTLRDYLLVAREDSEGVVFLNAVMMALRGADPERTVVIIGDSLFSSMVVKIFESFGLPCREATAASEALALNEFELRVPGPNHRREDFSLIFPFMFGRIVESMTNRGQSPSTSISGAVIQRLWCEPRWIDFAEMDRFIHDIMSVDFPDGRIIWDCIFWSLFDKHPRFWGCTGTPGSNAKRDAKSLFAGDPIPASKKGGATDERAIFEPFSLRVVSYLFVSDKENGWRPHFFALNTIGQVVRNCERLSNEWPSPMIEEISDYTIELRNRILTARNGLLSSGAFEPQLEWDEERERSAFERGGICTNASYHSVMADTNLGIGFEEADDTYQKWKLAADRLGVLRNRQSKFVSREGQEESIVGGDTDCENVFQLQGNTWRIRFASRETLLSDTKGLSYLHQLLSAQGKDLAVSALEKPMNLVADPKNILKKILSDELPIESHEDAGLLLDPKALSALEGEIGELKERITQNEYQDAEDKLNDEDRLRRFRALHSASTRKNGGSREFNNESEARRKRVTNAISRAMRDISKLDRSLGDHLRASINLGATVCYKPSSLTPWIL